MMTPMRVFFGCDPDPLSKQALGEWRDRYALSDGRPVPQGNFHVTLAFIGEIDESRLDRLCLTVDEWPRERRMAAGQLTLDRVGFWPRAGIYWAGAEYWSPDLDQLARKLQGFGTRFGAKRDKRSFTPHITLFRSCRQPPPAPVCSPSVIVTYREITLFESRQHSEGVHYTPLANWPLRPDRQY